MIYTIGYEAMGPQHDTIHHLLDQLDARLVDVRSKPYGRVKKGWGRNQLRESFGDRYEHRADLGGFGAGPTKDAIRKLASEAKRGPNLLLMCMEEAPGDCHRHHAIAMPLYRSHKIHVGHLVQSDDSPADFELVTARDLHAVLHNDRPYPFEWVTVEGLR